MIQSGVVISLSENGSMAQVSIERSSACEKCGACAMGRKTQHVISIPNAAGADVGDIVDIQMHSEKVVKASALMYLFPLVAFLLGLWGAGKVYSESLTAVPKDVFSFIIALAVMTLAFLIIRMTEKKRLRSGEFSPRMQGIAATENPLAKASDEKNGN
ncbi:MAG: SoxR reducing system RseC family protein [Christensenellales bacterium]|jgi:sigma-E factor negative regulatory protein RseC